MPGLGVVRVFAGTAAGVVAEGLFDAALRFGHVDAALFLVEHLLHAGAELLVGLLMVGYLLFRAHGSFEDVVTVR